MKSREPLALNNVEVGNDRVQLRMDVAPLAHAPRADERVAQACSCPRAWPVWGSACSLDETRALTRSPRLLNTGLVSPTGLKLTQTYKLEPGDKRGRSNSSPTHPAR